MTNSSGHIVALRIKIKGLVQGVGFRPFVFRLAHQHKINGWVANRTDGVEIQSEGSDDSVRSFIKDLQNKAPVISQIDEFIVSENPVEYLQDFSILSSNDLTDETSEISPDIAVCQDCLTDQKNQSHRVDYPFINCTNCGPRFSIIQDFPYDRPNTTMAPFRMCNLCEEEYHDIVNRRFHAQPIACNHCGPVYSMFHNGRSSENISRILNDISRLLDHGKIIAVKGLGGFHLMCDALNEATVSRLRQSKQHEGKPFAVMFRNLDAIKKYAQVNETEEQALQSWQRPIVILKSKRSLAQSVSLKLNTIGAFLPYMPFHHLLFERIQQPALILTSGNIAEEPIVIDNQQAHSVLSAISDAVLTYNRDIYNRVDDSVLQIVNDKPRILRRSRGFVPAPVKLPFDVNGIFAAGAELVNCFCIGKGKQAYLSQHIGDLKNMETFDFYKEAIERFKNIFRIKPRIAVSDMHPDYLSTRYAHLMEIKLIEVQHHHAHIASCMAENGLDEKVIGLAFDGTGYGNDGNIWGGEFMVCDYRDFFRHNHFEYMSMPGGDKVTEEPWRMGISLLYQTFGKDFLAVELPFLQGIGKEKSILIAEAIEKKINCPLTSSAGRLFDAIAAITGVCTHTLHHAEAPMRLESLLDENQEGYYKAYISDHISFKPVIRQICTDIIQGISSAVISAKFHNTIIETALEVIQKISAETGIHKVVLSGGTFQNKYLLERMENKLNQYHFQVFTHSRIPCNDGGIALGQIAIAGKKMNI